MSPEVFRTGYHTLFEVQLLHRYFLNFGTTEFDVDPTTPSLLATWRAYDLREFCRFEPSPDTRALLANQRLLLRPLAEGFRVAQALNAAGTAPAVPLAPGTGLTFWLYPTDPAWPLYTDLGPGIEPADLLPGPMAPAGQVLVLPNLATDPNKLLTLEPWPLTAPPDRPLAVLRLVPDTHNPLFPTQHFQYVFANRHTRWEYQGNSVNPDPLPLVRHGRVSPGGAYAALPNPSPATTERRLNGTYYSLIY